MAYFNRKVSCGDGLVTNVNVTFALIPFDVDQLISIEITMNILKETAITCAGLVFFLAIAMWPIATMVIQLSLVPVAKIQSALAAELHLLTINSVLFALLRIGRRLDFPMGKLAKWKRILNQRKDELEVQITSFPVVPVAVRGRGRRAIATPPNTG